MKRIAAYICLVLLMTGSDALSQSFYFGRNKVQYTDFQWMVLTTAHFNIYYYPEMKELAEIGANFAEESYRILENKFNHSINRRIPLIFYSSHLHFQQTNTTPYYLPEGVGGFFEFIKGRVVIPNNGNTYQFKRVIRHELVHVFMHSKIYWVQKNLNRTRFRQPPLWFTEGLAEIWSGKSDSQAEMVLADQVLEGTLVPLTSFGAISGSYLMYKEGENFLRYIENTYGKEKILMIMENFWRGKTFEDVFKIVIGKDFVQLNNEWIYHLKKTYYPLLENNEFPRMASQVITKTGFNQAPAFYRDGGKDRLFFISNTTGYTNIVSLDLPVAVKEPRPETIVKAERSGQFEAIHFLRSTIDVNDDGILAFVTKSGETDVLFLYDVHKREVLNSFRFDAIVMIASPAWSHDKKRVAFAGLNKAGYNDIYILNLDDGSLLQLTDDFYEDKDPAWSPDDQAVVFSSARNPLGVEGAYNLYMQDVQSGVLFRITGGLHSDTSPAWSPDGEFLAFTSDREGAYNIYVMRMRENPEIYKKIIVKKRRGTDGLSGEKNDSFSDGTALSLKYEPREIKKATHFTTGAFDPEWSPEGDIYFTGFENYGYQLRKKTGAVKNFEVSPVLAYGILSPETAPWNVDRKVIISEGNTRHYEKSYSLDIAQGQVTNDPVFGTNGGAQFLISDILGNDNYYLLLYNNAQTKDSFFRSFNFSLARYSLKHRTNFGYGLFHFSGRRYNEAEFFYNERFYGGFATISYPLSLFHRIEIGTNFGRSEKSWVIEDQDRIALLAGNYISYIRDNSLWGPTGPLDGGRYLFSIGKTKDISYNNVDYYTLLIDLRKYFRLSMRSSLAFRLMSFTNKGREAQRFFFGGSWDLRGYPRWRIWGQEINFFSAEYRFPFIDNIGVRFPFGGLGFSAIRGALFFDAARIRDETFKRRSDLGSLGAGLRFNLFGAVVLRLDVGKRIENDFSRLSGETFKQFFFGWDF